MVTTCEDTDVMCVEGELMKKLFTVRGELCARAKEGQWRGGRWPVDSLRAIKCVWEGGGR